MHFIITSLTPSIFFAPFCRQKGLDATLGEKYRQKHISHSENSLHYFVVRVGQVRYIVK